MDSDPNPRPYFQLDSECNPVKSGGGKRIGSSSEKGKEVDMGVIYRHLTEDRQKHEYEFNYFMAACKEVLELAKEEGILVEAKPILGDMNDLVNAFRTPPPPGKKTELSVAKAIVPGISPDKMERIMMDVDNQWRKSLFPMFTGRASGVHCHLDHLSARDSSIWDVVQVQAAMNLPSTLVPTRYFEFLRYRIRIEPSLYIIVDFSSSQFASSFAKSNCIRRPSGVIIRANTGEPEGCEIIWIENVEVDETREDNMYSAIINSKSAFGAQRCINTLLHNLKREKGEEFENFRRIRTRSFFMALTEAMKRFFMECVSQHPDKDVVTVESSPEDPIRILHNKTIEKALTFVGVTSFRVHANPLSVLQLLMTKDLRLEFLVHTGTKTKQVVEYAFATDDNFISLDKGEIHEEAVYILQEASKDEHCSFVLSKPLDKEVVDFHIAGGVQSSIYQSEAKMINNTPIGFAIMPDGPGGLECDACLVTFLSQMYYDRDSVNVNIETVRKVFVYRLNDIIQELNKEMVKDPGKMTELFKHTFVSGSPLVDH